MREWHLALLPTTPDEYINIPDYKIFRHDKGRVYIRDTLLANVTVLNIPRQPGIKIWLTVQHRKLPAIIIGRIYKHLKANVLSCDYTQEAITSTLMRKKTIFILGDFKDELSSGNKLTNIIKKNIRLTQIIKNQLE